jgi:hypothetical protein
MLKNMVDLFVYANVTPSLTEEAANTNLTVCGLANDLLPHSM